MGTALSINFGPQRGIVVEVFANAEKIGELYKEPDMTEWAADGCLEDFFCENLVAGSQTLKEAKAEVLEAAKNWKPPRPNFRNPWNRDGAAETALYDLFEETMDFIWDRFQATRGESAEWIRDAELAAVAGGVDLAVELYIQGKAESRKERLTA